MTRTHPPNEADNKKSFIDMALGPSISMSAPIIEELAQVKYVCTVAKL